MTFPIHFHRRPWSTFFLTLAVLPALFVASSRAWADEGFQLPPPHQRLNFKAWDISCSELFSQQVALEKLEALELANEELEQAIQDRIADTDWLRTRGFLVAGPPEYIQADARRSGFKQWLLPYAHTGFLFPDTVRKSENPNNKKRMQVDPLTYQGAILFLPGIGFRVSVADTVTEIAMTFNKTFNPKLRQYNGEPFRALGIPVDITLNGMASQAPYLFGSRRGSMAMLRHVHLVLHILHPHLKIAIAGRSQGGLLALAYGQTYKDHQFVGAIGNNTTYPEGEILRLSNIFHSDENELRKRGLDPNYHPKSFRSYLEFTEPDYARVMTDAGKVPLLQLIGELERSYPQPDYTQAFTTWAQAQPKARVEIIRGADHHFWSRPGGQGEAAFNQSLQAMVQFLEPLFYPAR